MEVLVGHCIKPNTYPLYLKSGTIQLWNYFKQIIGAHNDPINGIKWIQSVAGETELIYIL